jgi:hypothetical protein
MRDPLVEAHTVDDRLRRCDHVPAMLLRECAQVVEVAHVRIVKDVPGPSRNRLAFWDQPVGDPIRTVVATAMRDPPMQIDARRHHRIGL